MSSIAPHTFMGSPSRTTSAFQAQSSKMFLVVMFSVSELGTAAFLQIPLPSFLTWCCDRGSSLSQTHGSHPCDCAGNYSSIKVGKENPQEKLSTPAAPHDTLCWGLVDVVVFSQEFDVLGGLL